MMTNEGLMPWQIIQNLVREREDWSNEQILEELRSLPVLPDENYYYNAQQDDEYRRMDQALDTYLAILGLAGIRHLVEAIPLLLERASYGDYGETMRGLPNALFRIADIGGSAEERLHPFAIAALQSSNPGARQWAITTLYYANDPAVIDLLIAMLNDPAVIVAAEAASKLSFYVPRFPELRPRILSALREAKVKRPELNTNQWSHIDDSIKRAEKLTNPR
jgi:hypothetical protein